MPSFRFPHAYLRFTAGLTLVFLLTSVADVQAAGSLTLSGAAPGNFSVTLNGSNRTVYASLGSYTAADTRGTGAGWKVTFQATQFKCSAGVGSCPTGGDSLPAGSLVMPPPTVSCVVPTSCVGPQAPPIVSISANTPIDGDTAVKVASAATNKGQGTYLFTPGTIGSGNLQLSVPGSTYASTYGSSLTVSIGSGP